MMCRLAHIQFLELSAGPLDSSFTLSQTEFRVKVRKSVLTSDATHWRVFVLEYLKRDFFMFLEEPPLETSINI